MIYQASVRLMEQALFEGVSDIKRLYKTHLWARLLVHSLSFHASWRSLSELGEEAVVACSRKYHVAVPVFW